MSMPDAVQVDASVVIDELAANVGRLAKENAILRAQIASQPAHTIESETQQQ